MRKIPLLILCALALFVGCQNPLAQFDGREGETAAPAEKTAIRLALSDTESRSVFPSAPRIDGYVLSGSRAGEANKELARFTALPTTVYLEAGTWNLALQGMGSGSVLMEDTKTAVTVGTAALTLAFTLREPTTGNGSIALKLNWPSEAGSFTVRPTIVGPLPGTARKVLTERIGANQGGSYSFDHGPLGVGSYLLVFDFLAANDAVAATISEVVRVSANRSSAATLTLALSDFNGPPAIPTGLSAAWNASGAVVLTWTDASRNEEGFSIERSDGVNAPVTIESIPAGSVSYLDPGLSQTTVYSYRIRSINRFGVSAYTAAVSTPTGNTVTFDANGGSGTMTPQLIANGASAALTANSFSKDGCNFVGWTTSAETVGTNYKDGDTITPSSSLTLHAVWLPKAIKFYAQKSGDATAFIIGWGSSEFEGNLAIPMGITSIANSAFSNSPGLKTITIPQTVTSIGDYAFSGCAALESATIASGVTAIGNYAFNRCPSLLSVTIPSGVTSIGANAFQGSGLTDVVIPSGVTVIGEYAFSDCAALASAAIPPSVTAIGTAAFQKSGLTGITIPSGIATIGYSVFSGCAKLTSATIQEGVTAIGINAFSDCSSLTSVTIPTTVTSIGDSAFEKCALSSVTIPESVTTIGDAAFSETALTSVTIPAGVTSLGIGIWSGCAKLTSATISDGAASIGRGAFNNCASLTDVTIPSSVTVISGSAFANCASLRGVSIPSGVTSIEQSAFQNSGLTSVEIPPKVATIGDSAFNSCAKLASVTIPSGVASIGSAAFENCAVLSTVTLSEGLQSIGQNAFKACVGLERITIPSSATSIGESAFEGCVGLATVTLPEGLQSIGLGAFKRCAALPRVTIPSSATSIGAYAFGECVELTEITLQDGLPSIGEYMFNGCVKVKNLTVPSSVQSIGRGAFLGCASLTNVTMKSSTPATGGYNAFDGYSTNPNLTIYVPAYSWRAYQESWNGYHFVSY